MEILELRNAIMEMKNSLDGLNSREDMADEPMNLKIDQQK